MADLSDIGDALVAIVVSTLYPNGPTGPGAFSMPTKIYRGWPDPATLDKDLATSPAKTDPDFLHVSVFNLPGGADRTRYPLDGSELYPPAATFSASVVGQTITIAGADPNPFRAQVAVVGIETKPYSLALDASQTPAQIAASLRALIAVDIPGASVLGAVITIPAPYRIRFARFGGYGALEKEVGRSEKGFQVTIWANNDANRAALGRLLTPVLAAQIRLPLADGSRVTLQCRSYTDMDRAQRQSAYRRDLVYSVEYPTTVKVAAEEILAFETDYQDPLSNVIAKTLG